MKALLARLRCLFGWHAEPVARLVGVRKSRHQRMIIYRVMYCPVCETKLAAEPLSPHPTLRGRGSPPK